MQSLIQERWKKNLFGGLSNVKLRKLIQYIIDTV